MKRFGLLLVLLPVTTMVVLVAAPGVALAHDCTVEGGKYGTMEGQGMECPKHHVISAAALERTKDLPSRGYQQGHKISPATGPAVRIPRDIHKDLPTSGFSATAQAAREQEVVNVTTLGIVDAFDAAAKRDLEVIQEMVSAGTVTSAEYDEYVGAYRQARNALIEQLTKVHGSPPADTRPVIPDPRDTIDVAQRGCAKDGGCHLCFQPYPPYLDCPCLGQGDHGPG